MAENRVRVGFVGFGEVNSPRDLIERKCARARDELAARNLVIHATEPVSDDAEGRDLDRALRELDAAAFDVLVLCVAGWIPSQVVIEVADHFRHLPMVLWGLTGERVAGRLVTTADQAGTSALRHPMEALGYRFRYVYDTPDRPWSGAEGVASFASAAGAVQRLRGGRIGMMGYRDMNLYATLLDQVVLREKLGLEVEYFDTLETVRAMDAVSAYEVGTVLQDLRREWSFEEPVADSALEKGIRMFLAIGGKIAERGYRAVSLADVYGVKKLLHFPPGLAMMLLADRGGVASIPENDVAGSVTQLIVRELTGQVGAYFEFYEYLSDGFLVGVPDFVPSEVAKPPVRVRPWPGFAGLHDGVLNVSEVNTGRVTLCRVAGDHGRMFLHLATGEAVSPPSWEEAGWDPPAPQLPSLSIRLDGSVDEFCQKIFGQHYILAYGDHRERLRDFARITGLELL